MIQNNINKVLTILFLILAAAAVACYFLIADKTVFLYCGGAAVCIRLTQYLMRFIM